MLREIPDYIDLKFTLELPEIIISQRKQNNPNIYTGPGSIYQNKNGQLLLKLYSKSSESSTSFFNNNLEPGKIIADKEYYNVKALDMYGHTWVSNRVRIDKHYGQGGKYLIIFSRINQIGSEQELREIEINSSLTLFLNKKIKLPSAPFIEDKTILENKFYKNVRIFSNLLIRDYKITFLERSNWIEILASSRKSKLPENIDLRICEALQFITFTKLNWFYYEKFEGKTNNQKLNNINFYNINRGSTPPFRINFTSSEPNWRLFKLYLDHILDYTIPNKYHPISSLLNLIIQAEKLPIETRFQTICICVESILNSEFDLEIEVDSKLKENQTNIVRFIDEKVDKEYRDRLQALVAQLSNTRPVDKLYSLANDKLIEERLIKDWKDLRHRIIHGERIQTERLQDYMNKYYSSLTLFYKLIFIKIRYVGLYTDYSISGWPNREIKKT